MVGAGQSKTMLNKPPQKHALSRKGEWADTGYKRWQRLGSGRWDCWTKPLRGASHSCSSHGRFSDFAILLVGLCNPAVARRGLVKARRRPARPAPHTRHSRNSPHWQTTVPMGFSTAAAVPTLARAPRLNIGRTIAGRRTAALGHQPPEPQARCPPSPAPFWPLVPPDVFSVASGTAVPLAPGSSNKRIRSRLRAIYPLSLGRTSETM